MDKMQLENLSIFELRDFARKIGVFNPTVLKKNDLITAIQDVQSGKVKPHISKTKQGRPPKEIGRLVNLFMPEEIKSIPTMQEKYYTPQENKLKFNSNLKKPDNGETVLYKGYFELLSNNDGLLRKKIDSTEQENDRCFVNRASIDRYNLKPGDEVLCNAYFIAEDKPLYCDTVILINNTKVEEMVKDRPEFDNLLPNKKKREIEICEEFSDNVIRYGDTVFCYNKSVDDFVAYSVKFANLNKQAFDKYIYVSPASRENNYEVLKSFSDELFMSSFQECFSSQERTAFMAFNRAKRLAEMGQNVCLFVQDILEVVTLDNNDPNGELRISKDMLSSAKNLQNGSLTIICGFKEISFPFLRHKVNTTFAVLETCGINLNDMLSSK